LPCDSSPHCLQGFLCLNYHPLTLPYQSVSLRLLSSIYSKAPTLEPKCSYTYNAISSITQSTPVKGVSQAPLHLLGSLALFNPLQSSFFPCHSIESNIVNITREFCICQFQLTQFNSPNNLIFPPLSAPSIMLLIRPQSSVS
jgi:hypothetical protein